jgi:hypothetical protein
VFEAILKEKDTVTWTELVSERNSILTDISIVKSRIENYGKTGVAINTVSFNINTHQL